MCSVSVVAKRTRLKMSEAGFWIDAWTLEFADNTSGVLVCEVEAELQIAIHLMMDKFTHYFNSMGMCLNKSKCKLIIFRSSRKVRPYLSEGRAKLITESLVLSTISYMATLYLRLPTNRKKIQHLMNISARLVLRAPPRSKV